MQYQGKFTITKRDNVDFNFLLMRRKLISMSILVFVIIVAVVGLMKYAQGIPLGTLIGQSLLTGLFGVVLMTAINLAFMYVRINSMYKSQKISDFTFDALLDQSGFHAVSDRGSSDIPWERVLSVQESRKAFYVFITDSNANVLPKSQLQNAADAATLRKLFLRYLPAQKCKLQK